MDRFKDKADFSDLQVSSSTKVKPSLGHNNEQPLSQTVKRMHQHSPNREHSLNNNNNQTSTCSTNMTLGFAQNDSCDHGNVMDLQASRLYQPEYFLDKNKNESREGDDLSDTNSRRSNRNLFYSAQDSLGETFDQSNIRENTSSTDRQSGRPTERVHKSSIERQDSTTLDIGLGDCAQTQNLLFGEQVSLADSQASAHDLLARLNATNGSFKHPRTGAKDETCHDKDQYLQALYKLFQSNNLSLNGMPDTSSTNKQIREHSLSFPGLPGARDDETEHFKTRPIIVLLPCGDCSNSLTFDLNSEPGERRNKSDVSVQFVSKSSRDRSSQSVRDLGKGITSQNVPGWSKERASQSVEGWSNEGSKTWSRHPVNKKDVAMFVVIGLLAFGVFHLHGRVEAVERGLELSLARGCSSVTDAETSDSGSISSGLHAGPDAVLTQTLPGLGKDQQESASTNGATQTNVLTKYFNTKNSDKPRETNFSSNEQRLNTSPKQRLNISLTQGPTPLLDPLGTIETDRETLPSKSEGFNGQSIGVFKKVWNSSGLGRERAGEEDKVGGHGSDGHVYPSTDDVRIGARLRIPRDTAEKALYRKSRETVVNAKDLRDNMRKKSGLKGKKGDNKLKSNSEVYDARFSDLFPFSTNFLDKECAEHPGWDKGIQGCKEGVVKLQHRYSTLPFYTANNETASKAPSQRLMTIKKDTPGKFVVNIPGDYLVQLNIVLVVENPHHENKHFLAIFLNGQATLACHQGGFRCPHTNHEHLTKYKICNIIGLLQLNKNDTLDIRTMEHDMTVRIEEQQSSYFRTILLNKRT